MSILRTREAGPAMQANTVMEPFKVMRDLLGMDPLRNSAFWSPAAEGVFQPSFEVKETPGSYLIKADVPGVKMEDLDLQVTGNRLSINGKREMEAKQENEMYHTFERAFGSFTRSFMLPEDISADQVHAELREGVLTLSIPKNLAAMPKKIKING